MAEGRTGTPRGIPLPSDAMFVFDGERVDGGIDEVEPEVSGELEGVGTVGVRAAAALLVAGVAYLRALPETAG